MTGVAAVGAGRPTWRLRRALGPTARRRVRRAADVVVGPAGSILSVRTTGRGVALTFDDGPHPRWTPELLDLLHERGVSATFFLLTSHARRNPALVRRIVAEGHEVGLHGPDHVRLTTLDARAVRRRTRAARAELERIAGTRVALFRPPFGAQGPGAFLAVRSTGLDVVVWGPAARDWAPGTVDEVAARAMEGLVAGSVVLLHDGLELPAGEAAPEFDRTEVFRRLLDELAVRSWYPCTVGQLRAQGRTRRTVWLRP